MRSFAEAMRAAGRIAVAVACAFGCTGAAAQSASYVLMSLVGFELTFVTAGAATGSRLDANRYERKTLDDRTFDAAALAAMDDVLRTKLPGTKATMLAGTDAAWVRAARLALVPGSKEFTALIDGLASISERAGYDRLVLLLPADHDIRCGGAEGRYRSTGRAAGLGVYIDRAQPMGTELGAARGFLCLFANMRLAIVDVRKRTLLAESSGNSGHAVSAERAPNGDAADALGAAEKVAELRQLIRRETERLLPDLLARASP
jgi:hypothetical protein